MTDRLAFLAFLVLVCALYLVVGFTLGFVVARAFAAPRAPLPLESVGSSAPAGAMGGQAALRWPDDTLEAQPVAERPVEATATPAPKTRGVFPAPLVGYATWYGTGPGGLTAAAGPALRRALGNWRGRWVTVNGWLRVRLIDWCACRERIIDLSDEAFERLAPLSRGVIRVEVWL